ncbi:MAG: phenylalanine--tRNA ligase subunit alpha [Verrucomicrobiota bacterium]
MKIIEDLAAIEAEAKAAIAELKDEKAFEACRIAYLGKKGKLTGVAAGMRDVSKENKPAVGKRFNEVREAITAALDETLAAIVTARDAEAFAHVDTSLPGRGAPAGGLHPLTLIQDRAVQTLRSLGFALAEGPEVETEFHCFDALNTPEDHPARNEKDTFYFEDGNLLRTHTSSVQIRTMEKQAPPVRIIAPGSAYRRDEIDATHLSAFSQLEGLYVAEGVNLADLKGTLEQFFAGVFGPGTPIRFRPHFFPFTEPSFEIDVQLEARGQAARWIEIAGCGMVDPAVFESLCESRGDRLYDPERVTGFAFGMGLERLAMIMWGISDIRLLIENDSRFLGQFIGNHC